jgi:chaperonin cofactor prefoldin
MDRNLPLDVVVAQRQSLLAQLQQEREQIEALRAVVENLMEQLRTRQHVLDEIDSVLGMTPQLRLDEGSVLLRGRRLSEVAVEVLEEEKGTAVTVHYREWFELVRSRGHLVGGKEPLNTFLTQINRAPNVEKVGSRTGEYRLISGQRV